MEQAEKRMWEAIGNETMMCATYLPCNHLTPGKESISGNKLEVVVKQPGQKGVNYLCVPQLKFCDHMKPSKQQLYVK